MKSIKESIIGRKSSQILDKTLIIVPINEDVPIIKSVVNPGIGIIQTESKNGWVMVVASVRSAVKCDSLLGWVPSTYTRIYIADNSMYHVKELCNKTHIDILFKEIPSEFKEITPLEYVKLIRANK